MISEIQIENFKSISKLSLRPGSVTVLIGENGSGKSNILEAIAFGAAASADKLDDEFLNARGIRTTEQEWMVSKFVSAGDRAIRISATGSDGKKPIQIEVSQPRLAKFFPPGFWSVSLGVEDDEIAREMNTSEFLQELERVRTTYSATYELSEDLLREIAARRTAEAKKHGEMHKTGARLSFRDFMIYAPENTVLRTFTPTGGIKPLGSKGEGLLRLLAETAKAGNGAFAKELKTQMRLLGWFDELRLPAESDEIMGRLQISDRWLASEGPVFDQRSANEGFLYLLFYFTLLLSKQTPVFFAIDNLDASLNPKLCAELMRQIAVLAERNGKQVICTTHNPALLDGLNLHDDKQRLYVVSRNSDGHTVLNRVKAPRPRREGEPTRLSTAFMSGLLGGLPEHF